MLALIMMRHMNKSNQMFSKKLNSQKWRTASRLIGANEYNRMDGVKDASVCRDKCTLDGQCTATEYINNEFGSGNNSCLFYNNFDSLLGLPSKATDCTSSVWIKS